MGCISSGNKISVGNYSITICKNTIYQSIARTANLDTRENIAQLYVPIIKAMKWYLIPSDAEYIGDLDENVRDSIRDICNHAITGLLRLQETYGNKSTLVCLTLQLYINIISDVLNKEEMIENHSLVVSNTESNLANQIKIHFNTTNVIKLREFFHNVHNKATSDRDVATYIECIETILDAEDKKFRDFMYKVNTVI
jgi:hypothetical protein